MSNESKIPKITGTFIGVHVMKIQLNKLKLEISNEIQFIQKKLKKYPKGELFCCRNGKYVKWYKSNYKNPIYIKKSERSQAVALAEKKYYELQLKSLLLCRDMIQQYEISSKKNKEELEKMLKEDSPYIELLNENILITSKTMQDWMHGEYPRNPSYPENLIHKTYAGHMVRSKSEAMIANTLFLNKIPYRYENMINLNGNFLAPDFTILHPKTGELYYWEHFGLLDKPAYVEKSFDKLKIYVQNNIIPSVNLILTYENQKHPLDMEAIEKTIEEYF